MILLAFLMAAAPAAETPKAYMQRLYSSYRQKDFSPFDHPERYFAPKLLAAIREDARLAEGEVGYVDGDPVCQCQDTAGLHASITRVSWQRRDKALVYVSIGFTGDKPRPTTYTLVRTSAGWRIADISSADEPSFLDEINKSNREMRAKH
jgi:hypothetical protein